MIKFKEIIHKGTGISINYSDWLKSFKQNGDVALYGNKLCLYPSDKEDEEFIITAPCKLFMRTKDVLFSDEFEIIYDTIAVEL